MNDNTALFIFDFDGTLVKGHSHNYIGKWLGGLIAANIQNRFFSSYDERDKEKARLEQKFSIELMEVFLDSNKLGWKNEEQLICLFKNIISSGHKIAIASFNDYHHAVKYALEQLLDKEIVKNIYIKSGLPSNNFQEIQNCTKKEYIREIINNTGVTNKKKTYFSWMMILNMLMLQKTMVLQQFWLRTKEKSIFIKLVIFYINLMNNMKFMLILKILILNFFLAKKI